MTNAQRAALESAIDEFKGCWQADELRELLDDEARRTVSGRETKYARDLAVSLHRQHYSAEAPQWKPLDDLYGILSQIDNMSTGLSRTVSGQEAVTDELLFSKLSEIADEEIMKRNPKSIIAVGREILAAPIPATEQEKS